MDCCDSCAGFDVNYYSISDHEIGSAAAIQLRIFVDNRDRLLPRELDMAIR